MITLLAYTLNSLPDAARYLLMDTGIGHTIYHLVSTMYQVWEDGSISLP